MWRAMEYDRYRPTYAKEVFPYFMQHLKLDLNKSILIDIGCGTGILSEALLPYCNHLICVDPDPSMLDFAKNKLIGKNAECRLGTAENIPIHDRAVDAILAAQCFHWFDSNLFLQECRRILRQANSKVVLLWNEKDEKSDIINEYHSIHKKYSKPGIIKENVLIRAKKFFVRNIEIKTFTNDLLLDKDGFIGNTLSGYYQPSRDNEGFNSYINELDALFDAHAIDYAVTIKMETVVISGEVI